ncbi:MAG TPA: hypothetical protein VH144_00875 [Candidatus Saccharimonadales bacterium]|jgi:hypothetical protein|nr:hypothetical protein [Candidatus Saccharimonadales bacterium]
MKRETPIPDDADVVFHDEFGPQIGFYSFARPVQGLALVDQLRVRFGWDMLAVELSKDGHHLAVTLALPAATSKVWEVVLDQIIEYFQQTKIRPINLGNRLVALDTKGRILVFRRF